MYRCASRNTHMAIPLSATSSLLMTKHKLNYTSVHSYAEGKVITWQQFSSATKKQLVTLRYNLAPEGEEGVVDMCIDMNMDMRTDLCIDMCVELQLDVCLE